LIETRSLTFGIVASEGRLMVSVVSERCSPATMLPLPSAEPIAQSCRR